MKKNYGIIFFTGLILLTMYFNISIADWVTLTTEITVDRGSSVIDNDSKTVTYNVVFTNTSGTNITGTTRVLVNPLGSTEEPVNFDGKTNEEGQTPLPYYNLDATAREDLIESGESIVVAMVFPAQYDSAGNIILPLFDLIIKLNNASVDSGIFRKNISKAPEFFSGEGKLLEMPRYVDAKNTKEQLLYKDVNTDGFIPCEDNDGDGIPDCPENDWDTGITTQVKPLIVIYVEEVEGSEYNSVPTYDPEGDGILDGTRLAHDIYAAVSYDEGASWKRQNLSRTSLKSSFQLQNGVDYPGDSEKADVVVAGNQILVTWIDKYCQSGNPWDMPDGVSDNYLIQGPQKSVDYLDVKGDEVPRPDLGERPFSCVWAVRGVLQDDPSKPDYGTVVWYKGEQLTTGRRDAIRNFTAGVAADPETPANIHRAPGGFAVAWQEDPKGLKTGKGRGPGAGMSGACVNHKTDIWYSFINYGEKFEAVNENYISNSGTGDNEPTPSGDAGGYTPYVCLCGYVYDPYKINPENPVKFIDLPEDWRCPECSRASIDFEKITRSHPLNHFSTPIPITDNAVCKERQKEEVWGYVHWDRTTCDYYYEGGTNSQPLLWNDLPGDWECPRCSGTKAETFDPDPILIKYRHEGAPYCYDYMDNPRVNKDGEIVPADDPLYEVAYFTYTHIDADGNEVMIALDGNTGASRPNLSLVNWKGKTLAVMAYEETKGIGVGGDKTESAMEQAAPIPLVVTDYGILGGFTNEDCRSCHYDYVVPRDRVIPVDNMEACNKKNATWYENELEAYYPYDGYPFVTQEPLPYTTLPLTDESKYVPCVKFEGGYSMYPRDINRTGEENAYYALPDHLPGWHSRPLDCVSCHLPYNTKDLDKDTIPDRIDKCPGTPTDDPNLVVDLDKTSATCGCSEDQDPDAPDNNKDEPERFRHGKNILYHSFDFSLPPAVSHGHIINLPNTEGWVSPGSNDIYENARRVRVVPNPMYEEPIIDPVTKSITNPERADVTLGLLYKQGKDGQGAPADAFLRLFRNGFGIENIDGGALNLSSSTPYLFQDPDDVGNEDGTGSSMAGDGTGDLIGNHKTPKIDNFYWTDENLKDSSGLWLTDETTGSKLWTTSPYNGVAAPDIVANPFENVFSTRLSIRGNFLVAGFAYCTNWAAGKKARDHYDFYVRISEDGGETWTTPQNISQIKNHKESVSDCRIIQPPPTIFQPGADAESYTWPEFRVMPRHDFYDHNTFFVAIGTKENIPQPSPNETELEEGEVFHDVFFTRTTDRGVSFEKVASKNTNPKYDPTVDPNLKWIDNISQTMTEHQFDDNGIENDLNLAVIEFLEDFDWMAKGDANQGDVQVVCNPNGTLFHSIWEQELPLLDNSNQTHFQGTDVWYRKIEYQLPERIIAADINEDGDLTWDDGQIIIGNIGTNALDPDFHWASDIRSDNVIDKKDFEAWKKIYKANQKASLRTILTE